MSTNRKILTLLSIALYSFTLFSAQFFHSHEEEHHPDVKSLSLHSHFLESSENNDYSLNNDFHLSDCTYFSDDHIFSSVNSNIFFFPTVAAENSITVINEVPLSKIFNFIQCIPLYSRDSYVYSASNTSPPSV